MTYPETSVDRTDDPDDPMRRMDYDELTERAIEARAIAVGVKGRRVILTLDVGEAYVRWSDDPGQSIELAWAIFDAAALAMKNRGEA
jgi:hypothetical protein